MARLAAALAWLHPVVVLAAEEAHHDSAHGHGGVPWATLVFSTLNLGLFVFIIVRYAWPAIRDWVADRRRRIVEALEEASRAQREAEELKRQWEERVARLTTDIEVMRAQARADIARERDQILAAARQTAAAIERDVQRSVEQELRAAQEQLRRDLAQRAYALATERARKELTPADQERFIDDFLRGVSA